MPITIAVVCAEHSNQNEQYLLNMCAINVL